jgi:F-type H+/Na+-transporting ATPase subunit alpha
MNEARGSLSALLDETLEAVQQVSGGPEFSPELREYGIVNFVGQGIARVHGLPNVKSEELVRFAGDRLGMTFNLDPDEVGVVLLDECSGVESGSEVWRTNRVLDVPVGEALLGRVVDPLGRPLDNAGPVELHQRATIECEAPSIMDRAPVTVPLQTGTKVVDALIPVGRGQRELILGDRQTGKTGIAVDCILNQKGKDIICIYCAIGQRSSSVAKVIADLRSHNSLEYSIIVVAGGDSAPGLQFVAPYAAMSMGEYFMRQGRHALIVFDDLTVTRAPIVSFHCCCAVHPGAKAFPATFFTSTHGCWSAPRICARRSAAR